MTEHDAGTRLSRRRFLRSGAAAGVSVVGLAFAGFQQLLAKKAYAWLPRCKFVGTPNRWLDLPAGFSCHPISQVGEEMDDGFAGAGQA